MISDIPWNGPIGAVRIGRIDGEFVINPTHSEMEKSELDLRIAGTADAILMVEAGADQVSSELNCTFMRMKIMYQCKSLRKRKARRTNSSQ